MTTTTRVTIHQVDDGRMPVCWANYPNKAVLHPERSVGPTTWGETLWPVEVVWDRKTRMSRIGFSFIAPTEATGVVASD